jgi:hypothetical protein
MTKQFCYLHVCSVHCLQSKLKKNIGVHLSKEFTFVLQLVWCERLHMGGRQFDTMLDAGTDDALVSQCDATQGQYLARASSSVRHTT